MNAERAVQAAMVAALRDDAALSALANGVYEGEPARASWPYVVVGEALGSEWGSKAPPGREVRVSVGVEDAGEDGARAAAVLGTVGEALAAMDRDVGDGWRVVTIALIRTRLFARDVKRRAGLVDVRVRVLREG